MKKQRGYFDAIEAFCVGLILLLIVFGFAIAVAQTKDHKRFMADCTRDHQQYECDVMWGQAHPRGTY